jgi:hypothetical protein
MAWMVTTDLMVRWRSHYREYRHGELLCSSSVQIAAPTSASQGGVLLMVALEVMTDAETGSPESSMALQQA